MKGPIDKDTIVIFRAGDTVPNVAARRGEFAVWVADAMKDEHEGRFVEIDVRVTDPPPEALASAGIVVTGSSSSVTERAPWMRCTERFLAEATSRDVPVLGICFGHQLLAQALGGEVQKNVRGREIGTITVRRLADDPLFDGLPSFFHVNATHVDTVTTRPPGATVLAESDLEPTAAFAIGSARGVQFHPEIDADVMRGYFDARREILTEEGFDVDAMIARTAETPAGTTILRNFVKQFVKRR